MTSDAIRTDVAETYTTWGANQGACDHRHHARAAARSCLRRHRWACEEQGICSDRRVYAESELERDAAGHVYHWATGWKHAS